MRNLGRRSSQTCTTDTSHPPTSPGTDLADVAYQKHPCGGLAGRYFQHWKSQSLAPVSENCVFLGSKIYPKSFLKKSRFATVLEPFVGQLHFLPPHLRLLFQLLGSRSQHAIRAVLCWSLLILPFFLVWMPGGSLSLIFFHVQSIPPVCKLALVLVPSNNFSSRVIHFLMFQLGCLWQGGVCLCTISHQVRSLFLIFC